MKTILIYLLTFAFYAGSYAQSNNPYNDIGRKYFESVDKIVNDLNESKNYSLPTGKGTFVEGVHYYLEENRWVFTEVYHILKGSCCGNGCRHCPYGFAKGSR